MKKKLQTICCTALLFSFGGLYAQEQSQRLTKAPYGVVRVSVCNMRSEGRFTAGMTTQALLGMPVRLLENDGWYRIQTPDEYTGWAHRMSIVPMSAAEYYAWNAARKIVVTAHHALAYERADEISQPVSDLVAGCRLKWEGNEGRFYRVTYPDGRRAYVSHAAAQPEEQWRAALKQDVESILSTACSMMGFPYLWAGTSSKGVDCSGFVRTVLFMHDIIILRDAWQQAGVGQRIEIASDFSNLERGDLVFFGKPTGEGREESVSHVGFYLGHGEFIHSLGDVHVNSLLPGAAHYDAFNAGRLLFAVRFLPYINKEKGMNTTDRNPFYESEVAE